MSLCLRVLYLARSTRTNRTCGWSRNTISDPRSIQASISTAIHQVHNVSVKQAPEERMKSNALLFVVSSLAVLAPVIVSLPLLRQRRYEDSSLEMNSTWVHHCYEVPLFVVRVAGLITIYCCGLIMAGRMKNFRVHLFSATAIVLSFETRCHMLTLNVCRIGLVSQTGAFSSIAIYYYLLAELLRESDTLSA